MKRKLKGLLSLWLAVMMVLTVMPAAFAEGETTPVTGDVSYYTGAEAIEYFSTVESTDITTKTITFDKALNTQTALTLDSEKTHVGWRLWDYDGAEVGWPFAIDKAGVIPQTILENIANYLLEPVYQEEDFTIALYKGTEGLDPEIEYVPEDDPDYVDFDLKLDSALDTQINTVMGDDEFTKPANHIQDGWKLWSIESGLTEPLEKGLSDKVSYSEYAGTYATKSIIEPTWKLKYWFTHQPTVAEPYVTVNDTTGVSYQWYNATDNTITDENATAYTSAELSATYDAETGWTSVYETYPDIWGDASGYAHYYFSIELKEGNVLTVTPSTDDVANVVLESESAVYLNNTPDDDGNYVFEIDADGTYKLGVYSYSEDTTVKAYLPTTLGEAVDGATTTTLTPADGTFVCQATWVGETETPVVLVSDPVTFEEITITFDANGGTGTMESDTVVAGEEYELPECEFEAPYDDEFFVGWTIEEENEDEEIVIYEVGDEITVTKDITLSAVWAEKVATPVISPSSNTIYNTTAISIECATVGAEIYYTLDGTTPTTSSTKYTKSFAARTNPTIVKAIAVKEGMEDSDVATKQYAIMSLGLGGSSGGGGGSYGGGSSSFTVKFDTNGGLTIANQYVKKNGYVTEPEKPTKYGYEFIGWYTDEELTEEYDFDTKVTESFTLYAKWEGDGSAPADTNLFDDVADSDWFYDAVKYAYDNGLINGMSDSEFGPAIPLNRAMLVTILYRAEGSPEVSGVSNFTDIESGSYYEKPVMWAEENAIVNGMTETEFGPAVLITREQFATILYRYAGYKGYLDDTAASVGIIAPDTDSISDWALEAMAYCVENKIINGYEDGTIRPKGNTTRAEAAAMLQRFIEANN